ncbi:MAG: hypothetical protein OEN01_00970 [Candidatus Krumholzibacteria bacterium]|nr:hypothetical protein [Candidatus Krumholzibacteria bacterium]
MKLFITVIIIIGALVILAVSNRWKKRHVLSARYPARGEGTDADIERFIVMGRKLTAIKLYREVHGVDLKTAKEAVEELSRKKTSTGHSTRPDR